MRLAWPWPQGFDANSGDLRLACLTIGTRSRYPRFHLLWKVLVMKMRSVSLLSLALAVCLSSVMVAQQQGGGRGRGGPGGGGPGGGGRGGFGGGMGMSMGGAMDLLSLLRMEEVQKDIGLTADEYKSLQEAMPDMRALFQADESERPAKMKEANAKAQELVSELSPTQQSRLLGLLVQQQGMRSVTNEIVAQKIGLDAAKSEEIKAAMTKSGADMRAKMQEAFSGGAGGDREKMREAMDSMTKELDQAVAAKLSDDQKKKLEELKGVAFTFPERRGFGGGQGGGAPGAGAPGAGGGRNRNRGGGNNN